MGLVEISVPLIVGFIWLRSNVPLIKILWKKVEEQADEESKEGFFVFSNAIEEVKEGKLGRGIASAIVSLWTILFLTGFVLLLDGVKGMPWYDSLFVSALYVVISGFTNWFY